MCGQKGGAQTTPESSESTTAQRLRDLTSDKNEKYIICKMFILKKLLGNELTNFHCVLSGCKHFIAFVKTFRLDEQFSGTIQYFDG